LRALRLCEKKVCSTSSTGSLTGQAITNNHYPVSPEDHKSIDKHIETGEHHRMYSTKSHAPIRRMPVLPVWHHNQWPVAACSN
jgi:hypothetical protein